MMFHCGKTKSKSSRTARSALSTNCGYVKPPALEGQIHQKDWAFSALRDGLLAPR
jgi:hypothetical protein